MTTRFVDLIARLYTSRTLRGATAAFYYFAILAGLILLYGRGDFSTPGFIYQGF
jgi:hypothetical protein